MKGTRTFPTEPRKTQRQKRPPKVRRSPSEKEAARFPTTASGETCLRPPQEIVDTCALQPTSHTWQSVIFAPASLDGRKRTFNREGRH